MFNSVKWATYMYCTHIHVHQENRPESWTLTVMGSAGSVMLWGGISLSWFGSTWPLREKGHCKSITSCSEWSPSSCDESFLPWWEWSFPRSPSPSIEHDGTLNGWLSMKMVWIIFCGLRVHQNSVPLSTYGRFLADVLDGALHHHHQNTKWWDIFWE